MGNNGLSVVLIVANVDDNVVHEAVWCELAFFHDDGIALSVAAAKSTSQTEHQLTDAP